MRDTNPIIKDYPQLREQEYVCVPPTFHNKLKDGIPILWRIKSSAGGWAFGDCPYTYGQIFLDEIWEYFWKDAKLSDEQKLMLMSQKILEVYFHEFLHAYFFRRMFPEDMEKEYCVNPNKTIKQIKGRLHSEQWGHSEKMVGTLANNLMFDEMLNQDLYIFLMNTLREEIENIRQAN